MTLLDIGNINKLILDKSYRVRPMNYKTFAGKISNGHHTHDSILIYDFYGTEIKVLSNISHRCIKKLSKDTVETI